MCLVSLHAPLALPELGLLFLGQSLTRRAQHVLQVLGHRYLGQVHQIPVLIVRLDIGLRLLARQVTPACYGPVKIVCTVTPMHSAWRTLKYACVMPATQALGPLVSPVMLAHGLCR